MLEIKLKDGVVERMVAAGSTLDLVAEVGVVVSAIHDTMRKSAPGSAELFRAGLQNILGDDTSPIWTARATGGTGISVSVPKPGKAGGDGPGMHYPGGAGGRRMARGLDPGRGPGDLQKGGWT